MVIWLNYMFLSCLLTLSSNQSYFNHTLLYTGMHTYKQVQIIQLNTNKILQTCGNTQKHVELTGRSTEVSSRLSFVHLMSG